MSPLLRAALKFCRFECESLLAASPMKLRVAKLAKLSDPGVSLWVYGNLTETLQRMNGAVPAANSVRFSLLTLAIPTNTSYLFNICCIKSNINPKYTTILILHEQMSFFKDVFLRIQP